MEEVKIVFMGTPDFAVPVLEGLIENYQVIGVVSQPDRKVGRHQELCPTPVKNSALKNNILVLQPENIKNNYEDILSLKPDLIVTCAYGQIIPEEVLNFPKLGCINVHASLLPKLRGGAPIHRAIMEGYSKTGITIMYMDKKMDNGDIISQEETEILDSDNLETLHDRLSLMGRDLLLKTLPSIIKGENERTIQNEEEVTYAYNIKREEEHLDFSKSSREVFNHIRALSPVIGAFAILDGEEMKIYNCVIGEKISSKIGEVRCVTKEGIHVGTGDGEVILTDIRPAGKKRMNAYSYVNGLHTSLNGKVFK